MSGLPDLGRGNAAPSVTIQPGCSFGERRDGSVWMSFAAPIVGGHYQADFDFPAGIAAKVARAVNCHDDLLAALKAVVEALRIHAPGTKLNNHQFDALGIDAYAAIAKAERK